MPVRLLREGILDSEAVCSLSFPAEVFYRRLMSVVDDFGRFDGRSVVLRSRLYPLQTDKVKESDVERWLTECVNAGLVALYFVSGKRFILFRKLGMPRAKESKWPEPPPEVEQMRADENGCAQTKTDESRRTQTPADVPYSYSYSESYSDAYPPTPHSGGGVSKRQSTTVKQHPHFAAFWSAYPRKTAKPNAERAFSKIDPDDATLAAMLAALDRQRKSPDWCKDNGQYIPHPATWLNGRRWEDEPTEVSRPAMPTHSSTGAPYEPYENFLPKTKSEGKV